MAGEKEVKIKNNQIFGFSNTAYLHLMTIFHLSSDIKINRVLKLYNRWWFTYFLKQLCGLYKSISQFKPYPTPAGY